MGYCVAVGGVTLVDRDPPSIHLASRVIPETWRRNRFELSIAQGCLSVGPSSPSASGVWAARKALLQDLTAKGCKSCFCMPEFAVAVISASACPNRHRALDDLVTPTD